MRVLVAIDGSEAAGSGVDLVVDLVLLRRTEDLLPGSLLSGLGSNFGLVVAKRWRSARAAVRRRGQLFARSYGVWHRPCWLQHRWASST